MTNTPREIYMVPPYVFGGEMERVPGAQQRPCAACERTVTVTPTTYQRVDADPKHRFMLCEVCAGEVMRRRNRDARPTPGARAAGADEELQLEPRTRAVIMRSPSAAAYPGGGLIGAAWEVVVVVGGVGGAAEATRQTWKAISGATARFMQKAKAGAPTEMIERVFACRHLIEDKFDVRAGDPTEYTAEATGGWRATFQHPSGTYKVVFDPSATPPLSVRQDPP